VRLLAQGCTNREIAEALVISRGTIRTHVAHVLREVGLALPGRSRCLGRCARPDLTRAAIRLTRLTLPEDRFMWSVM
jgi:DNA-binding NarL/FixJ family response regulator